MVSIEHSVKAQFAKVFGVADWRLFKTVAESILKEATKLRKANMPIESRLKLLARNSRKRLLIGVGTELLLKAIYLHRGYRINRPAGESALKFPFLARDAVGAHLAADQTFMLDKLIENLPKIVPLRDERGTLRGLKIAKVFRNKEGHGVTPFHTFDASNYSDIAYSLSALYRDAFGEKLSVRFSVTANDRAIWELSRRRKR